MLEISKETRERTNKAIVNIRAIATQARKTQKEEVKDKLDFVVNLLDKFRKYVAMNETSKEVSDMACSFRHNESTYIEASQALAYAHEIYMAIYTKSRREYSNQYQQVDRLLSEIADYSEQFIK